MQSLGPRERDLVPRRRARVECALCGRFVDLTRLRAHLREIHRLESARLDQILAEARRLALRGRARVGGFSTRF
jgi:hypothetical protein